MLSEGDKELYARRKNHANAMMKKATDSEEKIEWAREYMLASALMRHYGGRNKFDECVEVEGVTFKCVKKF